MCECKVDNAWLSEQSRADPKMSLSSSTSPDIHTHKHTHASRFSNTCKKADGWKPPLRPPTVIKLLVPVTHTGRMTSANQPTGLFVGVVTSCHFRDIQTGWRTIKM